MAAEAVSGSGGSCDPARDAVILTSVRGSLNPSYASSSNHAGDAITHVIY